METFCVRFSKLSITSVPSIRHQLFRLLPAMSSVYTKVDSLHRLLITYALLQPKLLLVKLILLGQMQLSSVRYMTNLVVKQ